MELELKHIAPYLSYRLRCEILNYKNDYVGEKYGVINGYYFLGGKPHYTFKDRNTAGKDVSLIKPILRPLSDLTKEIEVGGEMLIPMKVLKRDYIGECMYANLATWSHRVVSKLIEWHFDIDGLIATGLAVDINTLK